jgi:hypothetical protein
MMSAFLDLKMIDFLTDGRIGTHDMPCAACGPLRRSAANQKKKVLRVWRVDPGFALYHCARCGESGYVRDNDAVRPDREALERARAEAAAREAQRKTQRLEKAQGLWSQRRLIGGSIAERYLREARGYVGAQLPPTLGYLPPRGEHDPALIAAFGIPEEREAGELSISNTAVRAVHITRLKPDGSDRERGDHAKIMFGVVRGNPIVLAPVNDLGGLAITEGIEDGLTVHEAAGLGVWVAGSHSLMPALAAHIPSHVECVTIFSHPEPEAQRSVSTLANAIAAPTEVRIVEPPHTIIARSHDELIDS